MPNETNKPDAEISGTEDTEAPGQSPGSGDRARPRLFVVGDKLGRYRLEEELGEGGMATVFRATDEDLRREVAIKVLFAHLAKRSDVVARFQREARAVAALDHPHILKVHDVGGGTDGEPPYLVLELVRGNSLANFFSTEEPLLAEVAAAMGVVLCDALQCAHDAGIIHRDLKPANVLIAEEGRLVLADFGVAHAEGDSLVTRTGAILGTPAFMSPEQAVGSDLTVRSDLYSLGATLYRLATGVLPHTGTTAKIVSSILQGHLIPAQRRTPAVGPDFSNVVGRLMATEPDDRYQEASEAREALLQIVSAVGESPDGLLVRYFEDSAATDKAVRVAAVRSSLQAAESALASGRQPRALALANRTLELDPGNAGALTIVDRASKQSRGWLLAAVVLLVFIGGGIGAYAALRNQDAPVASADAGTPSPEPDSAAILVATATIDAGVQVQPDADVVDASVTGPSDRRRNRDRKDRRPRRDAGTAIVNARRPDAAPIVRSKPDAGSAVAATGVVSVRTDTWCELSIDGVPKGRQKRQVRRTFQLPVGSHRLVCDQSTGLSTSKTVTVRAGATTVAQLSLIKRVAVVVRLSRGSSIRIGRRTAAAGETFPLYPGRYPVTVLSGTRVLGKGLAHVTAGKKCILRDTPKIGCY